MTDMLTLMLATYEMFAWCVKKVASMKRLLDEKNASMDRMKRKLEEARAAGRGGGAADRNNAARLTDRQAF